MKVILRSDVEKLGSAGDMKSVADGFARNYLIPRGLAMKATPELMQWFEKGREKRVKLREKAVGSARESAAKIEGVSLSFSRTVGDNGKLFGSVGKSDIAKSLKASGYAIDPGQVLLEAAIKEPGEHSVTVRLQAGVTAIVKVSIQARS